MLVGKNDIFCSLVLLQKAWFRIKTFTVSPILYWNKTTRQILIQNFYKVSEFDMKKAQRFEFRDGNFTRCQIWK